MADKLRVTVERFRRALADFAMLPDRGRILVGVSGGQDSVALLHLLSSLPPASHEGLVVAHFNHGLRKEADAEEVFVSELAARTGCRFVPDAGDVEAYARQCGGNLEAAGRQLRYAFFIREAEAHDCDAIALGHTGSDLAESLLMNILRGAGVDGLASIQPVNRPFIRPLVYLMRADTAAYCVAHGLTYQTDESNLDAAAYTRNRIRHCLLPALEADYGPGVETALLRAALAARAEVDWTTPLVVEAAQRVTLESGDDGRSVVLDAAAAAELPVGLLVRVLRRVCERVGIPVRRVGWEHYCGMANLVRRTGGSGEMALPAGAFARRTYGRLSIGWIATCPAHEPFEVELRIPGLTELPDGRSVRVCENTGRPSQLPEAGEPTAVLDAGRAGSKLWARTLRDGDRITPLGMQGTKKVSDLLIDEKVPVERRAHLMCVTDHRGVILWLPGLRISQNAAITDATAAYYTLRLTEVGREPCLP